MKEFWTILGVLLQFVNRPKTFAFEMSNSSLRKGSSIVNDNYLGSNGTVSTAFLNLTSIEASLQQISNGQSKTFIASNNKANDFSPTTVITEPVLPVLSTFSVAQTSTTQIENIVLSTNVPPENFASKHSSLNIQNDSSSAKPHSSAISSRVSELTPETTPTTSKFTGIILPSSPADKKNLSTSQARDNSYGYSYQGALTKSALLEIHEKRLNSQTRGQFSSSSSILGQISSYYDTTASANDGSRLFIEGSVSLKGLPQTFLHGSRTIWKTTQFYPREEKTTFMFSSQIHATQTSDTKMGTASEARKFSSISGMPQATLAAKTSPNKNDDFALTYATTTHPSRVTQMVASSVAHSQIQREISAPVSTVLTASPSNRKLSSQPGATTTILSTSAIPEPIITIKNSEFSSRPKKESPILRSSNREYSSSRMSFTIRRSSKDSESSFQETTKNIFLNQTTNFVPRETVSPSKVPSSVKKTSSLAATGLQTHSVPSRTVELKISFITRASASVKLSSQQTENLASLSSGEFSVRNSDSYRQTRISTSSSGISAIRFSSTQSSDMTRNVVLSSGSYSTSPSQILIQRSAATYSHSVPLMSRGTISENGHQFYLSSQRSAVSTEPLSSSTKHTSATSSLLMISHSQTPQRRSFATLEGQLFTPSLHSAVTVLLGKSKLQSSSPVLSSSGSSRTELTSEIIAPVPEESVTSYKEDKTHLGATVIPTQTRAFSATVRASVSTGHPASLATNLSLLLVVASSVTHSTIQREISLVSSVVTASPSVSRKTEKMSSQLSSTTTMTISTSPMIQQTVSGGIVSKFSSRPENELHKFTSSFKTDSFSRMSSSIVVSWSDYTSKYTTKVSVSISQNQTTNLPPDSTTSTTSNSEMSEASLAQKDFSVSTTFSPSHSTQMVNSSVDSSPSLYMSSTKASTKTQWLTKSVLKPTDWIPLSASQKFSALSTDSYHQTRISRSSHTHSSEVTSKLAESSASVSKSPSQIRSSTVSEDRIFLSSTVATLVDKSNTQSFSSVISTTSSRKEVTSEVIVPLPRGSVTSFKADSTKVGSTVNPTQTTAFSATVMANVTFPPSHTTQIVTSSIESLSSPYLPPTKAETKTKWLNQSMVQPTNWIPFSSSKTFSELSISSYHKTRISTSSSTQSSEVARSKLIASSASYSKSASQTPYKISSSSIAVSSHRQTPQKRSSAVSKSQKLTPSLRSSMTTLPDLSKWQSSSVAVSATSSRIKVSSQIIIPAPGESGTSYKAVRTLKGTTVHPTKTSSSSSPAVIGKIATGSPTTAGTDSSHIKLLIVIAIIPSVILCAFFAAVLLVRRNRKRRNKAVYSIKLEYADENNGFRRRRVNSRLDLSLKGITIDLEFPNMPSDRERRASYGRDSPRYSRGSNLSEAQMRELQILSQECKENMEWISEVIAREMETSICARIQPINRESVYSVKEKENYEPSEKGIIRRESSKRGRETVKWRIPVVQRHDSEEFDQRDSMCTDDTTLFPEDWKDSHQNSKRSLPRNTVETHTNINHKPCLPGKLNRGEENSDKELRVPFLCNKKLDEHQSQNNDNKGKELAENIPLTVNLNPKKEDTSHATQGKRPSARPRRFESL